MNTWDDIDSKTVMQMNADYVMNTINRLPVVLVRGEGMYVWDSDGKKYLDFLAGIAVNGIGHCHPDLASAICRQASTLMLVTNLYYVPQQPALAKRLVELSGLGKVFFCNSGGEANETAIKLARKWAKASRSPKRYEFISALGSFHGRSMYTVAATGQPKYHQGFEPLPAGFNHVPYNDLEALRAAVTDQTLAVILEPIQGESGVWPATQEYLENVRELCNENGLLLILDEVQTGLGRTGKWFGFQHYGIRPDIMTLAKTLGGGFPIGACLATDDVAGAFQPSSHNSTFGGNPLACAASLATLEVMEREKLIENSAAVGAYLKESLQKLKAERKDITEVRGKGLMVGLSLAREDAPAVSLKCMEYGLLTNPIGTSIMRFLPPLIARRTHVDTAVDILRKALSAVG